MKSPRAAKPSPPRPSPRPAGGSADGPAPRAVHEEAPSRAKAAEAPPPPTVVRPGVHFPVVALGASAGGLDALSQLLTAMDADTGIAFVVVQHLDPVHESMLSQLLAKATPMPVIEVTEGIEVEPNHVYVIPPNQAMQIEDGMLKLTPRAHGVAGNRPIDTFLFSLAAEQRNRAIGVILSGTASDGTLGLKAIKEQGGITFAQDRGSAKFDGMPTAAVASGAVDFILPPEGIAAELIQIARHPYVAAKDDDRTQFTDERLATIFGLVRAASGVDFTFYKSATIRRRIMRRMMLNRIDEPADYVGLLQHSPAEVTALFNDILINVTEFFRDPEVFDALKTAVLPEIIRAHGGGGARLRIWVPGCAAGEEAYSIAICLLEIFEETGRHTPVQIFATDISESALEKARAGVYPEAALNGVSPQRRSRFFVKIDGGWQVAKVVRDMCLFARQDLAKDPPFSRLDLISCRNVLIYLGATLQRRIIPSFYYALRSDGFLVLGTSESIGPFADQMILADKQHKIYRKRPGVAHLHVPGQSAMPATHRDPVPVTGPAGDSGSVEREADRMLLGRYSPPGVLINEAMNILQFRGQTGLYLEPAAGAASLNLMKMVRSDLQTALRKLINEALRRGTTTRVQDQRLRVNGHWHTVDIEVIPVSSVPVSQGRYFLVSFIEGKLAVEPPAAKTRPGARSRRKAETDEVARLRQELVSTREYLQSVIEEQETANEELRSVNEESQSSNEELQSINEELETAKEELQSTNEELTTINEELENVNQELTQANNDLMNLLHGVDVAIVMLGADQRIRRFTPLAASLLNLIPSDVGRPLADLNPRIDVPDLGQWIASVTETLVPLQRGVKGGDQNRGEYDLRIKPYRTTDNRIDGVVMTVFERGPTT